MKQSVRAKRMARHHSRMSKAPTLNLVSLMDIFTILVFFLLVNSSDVEVIESDGSIKLPVSISEEKPEVTLMVKISATEIIIAGNRVATVTDFLASKQDTYAPLIAELKYQAQKAGAMTEKEQKDGRKITIMGDQLIPYELLKKVMINCVSADYRDLSLAVTQKEISATAEGG
jgi:biopolymer transport protein ExbD